MANAKNIRQACFAICKLGLLCFIFTGKVYGQYPFNLVNNYSFEDYAVCPNNLLIAAAPSPWYSPTNSYGAIYANSCSTDPCIGVPNNCWGTYSYQYAHTGNAYIGLPTYTNSAFPNSSNRYYVQTKLKDSLLLGKYYYAQFWVSLINSSRFASNNIYMAISNNAIWADTTNHPLNPIPFNAQVYNYSNPIITDTLNWVKVSSIYVATGGEKYITIGNFKYDYQTAFQNVNPLSNAKQASYYIDDVSVIPLDSFNLKADAGKDTTIHIGDSVFIGSLTNGIDTIKWLQNGILPIDSTRPGFWVKPLVNTCYVLTQTVNGYTSSDTVCINVLPLPLKFIGYTVISTQEKSVHNNWQTANEINVSHYNIQRSTNGIDFINIGSVKAQNKTQNNYTYNDNLQGFQIPPLDGGEALYYHIQSADNDGKMQYSTTKQITIKRQTPNSVSIYPNPAKDVITISSKENIKEVKIINQLGQVVQQLISNNQSAIINVQGLAKGLYLLQITTSKSNLYNEKLLVQ